MHRCPPSLAFLLPALLHCAAAAPDDSAPSRGGTSPPATSSSTTGSVTGTGSTTTSTTGTGTTTTGTSTSTTGTTTGSTGTTTTTTTTVTPLSSLLLADDFETGTVDPSVWTGIAYGYSYSDVYVDDGLWSLHLGWSLAGDTYAETVPVDTSQCGDIVWGFDMKRGPAPVDDVDELRIKWFNGNFWEVDTVLPGPSFDGRVIDPHFLPYTGTINDAAARRPDFQLRLEPYGNSDGDDFYVDDFVLACDPLDQDTDGLMDPRDCAPFDPDHWGDCAKCVDADGDQRGAGCDRGDDCDDTDATVFPGAADVWGDGLDTDCSGHDGPGISDGFERGLLDPSIWPHSEGHTIASDLVVHSGTYALKVDATGLAQSLTLDTTNCLQIFWSFQGKRGPNTPEDFDFLTLSWDDGSQWIAADRWEGRTGYEDPAFGHRWGVIDDVTALWSGFRIQFAHNSIWASDDYYVDDLQVGCTEPDADGDGYPPALDVDDTDPLVH